MKPPVMFWKDPRWYDRQQRQEGLDEAVERSQQARFGLRQMPPAEKIRWVQRHFSRVAPHYDFMNSLLSMGIQHLWKRAAVRMLELQAGMRVLDVCGGTADLALLAAERVGPRGRVVVYDINAEMLAIGRRKVQQRGLSARIDFVLGDAERIACAAGSFDAAIVGFGIRNLTHLKAGFQQMRQALKPGGSLLCLEFSRPRNPFFRQIYDWYSFTLMPLLGQLLTGSAESYACLPETIRMFPLADELAQILTAIGLQQVHYRLLTDGIAAVHVGRTAPLSPAAGPAAPAAAAAAAAG